MAKVTLCNLCSKPSMHKMVIVFPVHLQICLSCSLVLIANVGAQDGLAEIYRSNLHKKPLRIAGVMSKEYAYDTAIVQRDVSSYDLEDSFAVELLKCLEFTMNFTTVLVITNFWGHLLPNKSWTGMIALLLEDKVDVGLSSIADRPFRREVVDFNIPTNEIRLSAFFQKTSTISSGSTALLKPFQPEFWIALFILLLGMILATVIISKVLNKSFRISQNVKLHYKNKEPEKIFTTQTYKSHFCQEQNSFEESQIPSSESEISTTDSTHWTLLDSFNWSISIISLKGFYKIPSATPYRVAMMVGSVSGFVIFSAYAGTLVSFLSVVTEPIQNLGQLLSTDFQFFIINEPLAIKFLAESPDAKGVNLYQRSRNDKTSYSSMKDASSEINKGEFVFVSDHAGAYESLTNDFSTTEACRIREIEIENAEQKQGTLVQKNSPYKRIIDYQILRMIQYGLVKRWNSKYLKKKPACENKTEYEGVSIESVLLAFELLLGGFLLGKFLLFIEYQSFKRKTALSNTHLLNW